MRIQSRPRSAAHRVKRFRRATLLYRSAYFNSKTKFWNLRIFYQWAILQSHGHIFSLYFNQFPGRLLEFASNRFVISPSASVVDRVRIISSFCISCLIEEAFSGYNELNLMWIQRSPLRIAVCNPVSDSISQCIITCPRSKPRLVNLSHTMAIIPMKGKVQRLLMFLSVV